MFIPTSLQYCNEMCVNFKFQYNFKSDKISQIKCSATLEARKKLTLNSHADKLLTVNIIGFTTKTKQNSLIKLFIRETSKHRMRLIGIYLLSLLFKADILDKKVKNLVTWF